MLNVVENDASLGGIGEGMSDKGVGSVSRLGAPVTAPFFVCPLSSPDLGSFQRTKKRQLHVLSNREKIRQREREWPMIHDEGERCANVTA